MWVKRVNEPVDGDTGGVTFQGNHGNVAPGKKLEGLRVDQQLIVVQKIEQIVHGKDSEPSTRQLNRGAVYFNLLAKTVA